MRVTPPVPPPARLRLLGGGPARDEELVQDGPVDDADPFGDREDDLLDEPGRSDGQDGQDGDGEHDGSRWLAARGRWGVPVLAAVALLVLAAVVALVLGVRAGALAPGSGPGSMVAPRGLEGQGAEGRPDDGGTPGATGAPTTVERTGPVVGGAVGGPTRVPGALGGADAPEAAEGTGTGPGTGPGPGGGPLTVHVVGAVAAPGVVSVPAGSRAVDAVAAAGGMTAEADPAGVNLARPLADGEQVVVPRPGEVVAAPALPGTAAAGAAGAGGAPGAPAAPVDLNTASAAQLDALPGIGPVLAQRIVETRQAHGAFATVDELVEVPGIGDAVLEKVRSLVRV